MVGKVILKTGILAHPKQILHNIFTDAMYNDAPFGYDLFPHDEQITTPGLVQQSKQFDAINTKGNHVWIVIHKADDVVIVKEAMVDRGYKNLQQVYWYQPNQYTDGPVNRLTNAVTMITFGCMPSYQDIHWNVSNDPRERHNFVSIPSVLSLAKDTSGNTINVTEKPPELAEFLLGMFCQKGSTVLIVGTGAGGCVKGALRAGFNVIGVENDEKQYNQLFGEMNKWIATMQKEDEEAAAVVSKGKKSAVSKDAGEQPKEDGEEEAPVVKQLQLAQEEGKCFSCDLEALEENPLDKCSQCGKINHVKECMEDIADEHGDLSGLVCAACKAALFGEK